MAATTAAVVGGVASAASAANSMSSSGGGGAPKWQTRNQRNLVNQANNVSQETAEFTPDQLAAQQGVRDLQGRYSGDYAGAQATAQQLAGGLTQADISQFYNPYENDVIGAYLADLQQMRGQQDVAVSDAAQRAGAFGGDREAVYRASIQGDLDRTGATTLAGLRSQGFTTAANLALNNQGQRLAGNAQLANLIGQRVGYDYGDLGALDASGAQQQALDQTRLNERIDTLKFRSGINNPGTGFGGATRTGDPVAGALSGFQDGYKTVQGALDLWNGMRTPPPILSSYGNVSINPGPLTLPPPATL